MVFDEIKVPKALTPLEAFLGPEAYKKLMEELEKLSTLKKETNVKN